MSLTTQSYDIALKVRVAVCASPEILDGWTPEVLQEMADEGAEILAELVTDEIGAIYQAYGGELEVTEATGVPVSA